MLKMWFKYEIRTSMNALTISDEDRALIMKKF